MRSPLAFLSFDVDHDEAVRSAFLAEASDSTTFVNIDRWSTHPQNPRVDWDKLIQTNISRCDLMIVLVGSKTKSAEGVLREIGYARRSNVPFFGVYVEGVDEEAGLPDGLSANRITRWDWKEIDSAVKQMMTESKNHSVE
jgi:hypothetical protein